MRTLALPIALLLVATSVAPAFAGMLEDRFVHGGGCYIRQYDAAHLAAHPNQQVTQVNLELSPNQDTAGKVTLYFEFTLRDGERYGADAYCDTLLKCSLEADGGTMTLAPSNDAIKITVGKFLELEGSSDFSPDLAQSADDRVFVVNKC